MNRKLETKPIPRAFSPIGRGSLSKNYFNQLSHKQLKEFSQENMQESLKACNCRACRNEICIDYLGNIYPCALLIKDKYKLGNIFDIESVSAIVDETKLKNLSAYREFEKLYPDKIEKCNKCDLNIFCWSCLHFADMYIGTDEFIDRCLAKKEALDRLVWNME